MKLATPLERISVPGLDLEFCLVPWDSDMLGMQVAQIEHIHVATGADPTEGMEQFRVWRDLHDVRFACRLPSLHLRESMLLEEHGFRFVEMVYRPSLSLIPGPGPYQDAMVIARTEPSDLPTIDEIAWQLFRNGSARPGLALGQHRRPRTLSHLGKRNSLLSPNEEVLKATLGSEIVGFFIVEDRDDGTTYWHLTAIAPAWQGKGVGGRLWRAMIAPASGGGARDDRDNDFGPQRASSEPLRGTGFPA